MSRSLKFANVIAANLRSARIDAIRRKCYRVKGQLETTAVVVDVEVYLPWFFRDLKRKPPRVWCREPWMKIGADWHNDAQGMCWILPDEWRDAMSWMRKPVAAIISEGQRWLFNNVRLLVDRHYLAHIEGVPNWSREWDAWSHYKEGVKEYRRQNGRRRHLRKVSR